ncbi:MAG: hypothetical protein GY820_43330, partial [Gammaproteobacteria bacterium]|nr:hypothetical protein [Gammaproteobacteria bacterium]
MRVFPLLGINKSNQSNQINQNFGQNHDRQQINNGTQNQHRTVTIEDDDRGREDDNERQDNRPHPNPNPPPYPQGYDNGYQSGYSDNQIGTNDSGNHRYSSDT